MRALLTALLAAVLVVGGATAADASTGGRTEYRLKSISVVDRVGRSTVVGNGATVQLSLDAFTWRYTGERFSRPRIVLQRYRAGAWRIAPTASLTVPKDLEHDDVIAWTKPYRTDAAVEEVRYRFLSVPYSDATGTVSNRSASPVFTVRYENQDAYTGLARTAWQAVAAYCPTTAIRIGGTGDAAGLYTVGTQLLRLMRDFDGYTDAEIRGVALHECAHERQWLNYGSTPKGDRRMEKAAKRVFVQDDAPDGSSRPYDRPFDPVEHGADCSALAAEPGAYLGYGGWCDEDELAAGLRVLQGGLY